MSLVFGCSKNGYESCIFDYKHADVSSLSYAAENTEKTMHIWSLYVNIANDSSYAVNVLQCSHSCRFFDEENWF